MDVFEVIAEPNRRAMLDLLADRERSVGELVDAFPSLSQPAVSRHLRVLRDSGLVVARISRQQRIYSLQAARLAEIDTWISRYRRYWSGRLDALEVHLARVRSQQSTKKRKSR